MQIVIQSFHPLTVVGVIINKLILRLIQSDTAEDYEYRQQIYC